MKHIMKLNANAFERMKNGTKVREYRVNDEKRSKVKIGDVIEFKKLPNLDEGLKATVIDIKNYNDLKSAIEANFEEDFKDRHKSVQATTDSFNEKGYYTKEEIDEYGIVVFKIKTMKSMVEDTKKQVFELLSNDKSGHDNEHVKRVYNLALKFAKEEKANEEIVSLAALLHDVDDYKLVGIENSKEKRNAKNIMIDVGVPKDIQNIVLGIIDTMGYKKCLAGVRPKSLEGMIVSDADMCDAIGANGIIRTHVYTLANDKPFFDKKIYPIEDMNKNKYNRKCSESSVCHFFEKSLKLKDLMMTEFGKKEAIKRHDLVVSFLYQLFDEEEAYEWKKYLDNYLTRVNFFNKNVK